MVCEFAKTKLYAARLAVRPGLDYTLYHDGDCCISRLETQQ